MKIPAAPAVGSRLIPYLGVFWFDNANNKLPYLMYKGMEDSGVASWFCIISKCFTECCIWLKESCKLVHSAHHKTACCSVVDKAQSKSSLDWKIQLVCVSDTMNRSDRCVCSVCLVCQALAALHLFLIKWLSQELKFDIHPFGTKPENDATFAEW